MKLPNSDISIMMVRNAIGCPSTDLGTLVAKAKTGGTSGYAFKIKENGGAENDGALIDGASPYWNIWAAESPGEWVAPGIAGVGADNIAKFRLKRGEGGKYAFRLGAFKGYNHDAKTPDPGSIDYKFTQNAGSGQLSFDASIRAFLGEYNWSNIYNATHYRVVVLKNSSLYAVGNAVPLSNTISPAVIPLKVGTSSLGTYSYITRIELGIYRSGTGDFETSGYLPVNGELNVTIYRQRPEASLRVIVGNRANAFKLSDTVVTSGNYFNVTGEYNFIMNIDTVDKRLKSALYEVVNENGTVLRSYSYSSFDIGTSNEQPLFLRYYFQGDSQELFQISRNRVQVNNNEYLNVTFTYE